MEAGLARSLTYLSHLSLSPPSPPLLQGLTCTSGSCTLDFAQIATERLSAPDLDVPPSVISKFKVEVSVYNMDGVESSKRSAILNNA